MFPQSLPEDTESLIKQLDEKVQPPFVKGPECREQMDHLIFEAGRRSLVNELIVIQKRPRR